MKIFLSFSFNHGQDLTRMVERLLASHDVVMITGRKLGGEAVDAAVAGKLENDELLMCSHRLVDNDLTTPWKEVPAISEEEGMFVYLRGVKPGHRIQLRVMESQKKVKWQSPARLPWTMVQLKERQNG